MSTVPPSEDEQGRTGGRALPWWLRRAADGLLVLTVVSLPLSTSGMQVGIVGLGLLAVLARLLGHGVMRRTPLDGALALFFAALAMSTLASGAPHEATGWARPWVVLAYFAVFWWLRDRTHAARLALLLVAAGAVAAAYGILQHHTGVDWYREVLGRPTRVRPRVEGAPGFAVVGFFKNYLTFAHAMVFPLGFAAAFALHGLRAAAVAALLDVIAVAYSTARGVWLALAATGVVLAGIAGLRAAAWALGLLAAALAVGLISPGLRAQVEPLFTTGGANAGRIAIYAANLDIIHERPVFGLGFGRYRRAAAPYYGRWPAADRRSHAHSNFLHIGAEAGLVGVAAFGFLFASILSLGWRAVASAPDASTWATAVGAWIGVWAFLLGGLTQFTLGDNEVATGMWVTVALLMRCVPGRS